MPEEIKKIEKPSEKQKNVGDLFRFINTVEAGEVDESPTTLETRSNKSRIAGNTRVED